MAEPLPEDFRDAAKRSLASAMKPFLDPESKRSLIERAKILMQLAVQTEQSMVFIDSLRALRASSNAALDHLRKHLDQLAPGMTHHMATSAYVDLLKNGPNGLDDAWEQTALLSRECDCEVEFRPGGTVWFVKRGAPAARGCPATPGDPDAVC